jgi:peptide/nickel transport system permease protein
MSGGSLLTRAGRAAISLVVAYTISFLAMAYAPNPNVGQFGYVPRSFVRTYREPRFAEQAAPLAAQFLEWAVRLLTLDLGSVETNSGVMSISSLLADSLLVTAVYLVPAALFAIVTGTVVQLLAVAVERRDLTKKATVVGAAAVATPVFLFAYLIHVYLPVFVFRLTDSIVELGYDSQSGGVTAQNLRALLWPFLTMTAYLFAIQLRAAGADLSQYAGEPFVKTARAKGVGIWGVCRHVFPHSAARLLTVLTSEMLGIVLVGLYVVEWVTRTPGFGTLTIDAVGSRHPGLIFGVVLLPVVLVVTMNFLQDAYYELIDPRVDPVS